MPRRAEKHRATIAAFGIAVREHRLELGMSQEDLAAECGLDRTYVSGIERGVRNPTLRVIRTLASGLGCTPGKLVSRMDQLLDEGRDA